MNEGKKIHMIAVCGIGMGSLAGYLKECGARVTGSDNNIYPPMSEQLNELGISVKKGYSGKNIEDDVDFVIVGNAVTKDNPEVKSLLARKIRYFSMPGFLEDNVLSSRRSVMVAGTHGKTTAASLLGWTLEVAGEDPSVLVGGIVKKWDKSYRVGRGKFFVLEGDEYDSAFFDKIPKFLHYRAKDLILTGIEFDHADIYQSLEVIKDQFGTLVSSIPKEGSIVLFGEDNNLGQISLRADCATKTYGFSRECDFTADNITYRQGKTVFEIFCHGDFVERIKSPMIGKQNVLNTLGVFALLNNMGIDAGSIKKGIESFPGVKRRQETIFSRGGITIIDDFAHHPTAIRMTVEGFKLAYPEKRLWAIFEPRTNTSRRKFFQTDLPDSFMKADKVIVASVYNEEALNKNEVLDVEKVVREINKRGGEAFCIREVVGIVDKVTREAKEGDIILVMSNGAFEGIYEKLMSALRAV